MVIISFDLIQPLAMLMIILFVYDIFFVFITPLFTKVITLMCHTISVLSNA